MLCAEVTMTMSMTMNRMSVNGTLIPMVSNPERRAKKGKVVSIGEG